MSVNKIPEFIKIKDNRIDVTDITGYRLSCNDIQVFTKSNGFIFVGCSCERDSIDILNKLDKEMKRLGVKFNDIE